MSAIREWLRSLGLSEYADVFDRERIDLAAVCGLSDTDLRDLGLPIGTRSKLRIAIDALRTQGAIPASDRATVPPSSAERRQLTVMFCDLVDSTRLSHQLDPEQLRELMQRYQTTCGTVIQRYAGHVAQYLGDGLMVYFGWPAAHEDDAERAVRVGLEIVQAIRVVAAPQPLQVRIGIATGQVVVGETGAGDASIPKMAVGETPNLAARLQSLAGANEIVIGDGTHRLLGGTFEYVDLGEHILKGIVDPVRAWRVNGIARAEGRFEAAHAETGLTPLVGREEEVAFLMRRWAQAKQGEGQVVLMRGEPGIGKSRITQVLRSRLETEPHIRLNYQCSPFQTQSALFPLIEQLERAAAFARDDTADRKLDKLEALLGKGTDEPRKVAPLFAHLLSLPADRYPPLGLTAQKQKERMLQALVAQVEGLSRSRPLLMVLEDAHWVDPTTQELFDLLVARMSDLPVLLLVSFRPEYVPRWSGQPHVSELSLSRLNRRQGAQMVQKVTGGKALPAEMLDQIVAKTEGVPLFVEELTKTMLESGLLIDRGDRYDLSGPLPPLAIPSTLHDSLMARLDRLAPIREVAQIGACIGREFSHELLLAVAPLSEPALDSALEQLSNAQLVFQRGTLPDAIYLFKHALVQDAAYSSLLKSKRQQYHQRIAAVMVERFTEEAETQPEFVAHQFTEAGLTKEAITWWQKAGKRASLRAAPAECVANYEKALKILASMSASLERDNAELGLQVALGFALMLLKGWGAPETGKAIQRAAELGRALNRAEQSSPDLYWSLRAPGTYYMTMGRNLLADDIAEEALRVAARGNDIDARIDSHNLRAMTAFVQAKFPLAREHAERGLALYGPNPRKHPLLLGQDTKIRLSWWHAWTLWWQGYPDRALERGREIAAYSSQSSHPFEKCWAMMILGTVQILRRESSDEDGAMAIAVQLAREHEFNLFKTWMPCYQGALLALQGRPKDAIAAISEQLPAINTSGNQLHLTLILAFLAEACLKAPEVDEGLRAAEEGLRIAEENAESYHAAELHRLRGELLEKRGRSATADAEAQFLKGLDVARTQGAKALELRAAMSLTRLWQKQDKHREAADLLAPVYAWFTEGFATKDLMQAKTLLEELVH